MRESFNGDEFMVKCPKCEMCEILHVTAHKSYFTSINFCEKIVRSFDL